MDGEEREDSGEFLAPEEDEMGQQRPATVPPVRVTFSAASAAAAATGSDDDRGMEHQLSSTFVGDAANAQIELLRQHMCQSDANATRLATTPALRSELDVRFRWLSAIVEFSKHVEQSHDSAATQRLNAWFACDFNGEDAAFGHDPRTPLKHFSRDFFSAVTLNLSCTSSVLNEGEANPAYRVPRSIGVAYLALLSLHEEVVHLNAADTALPLAKLSELVPGAPKLPQLQDAPTAVAPAERKTVLSAVVSYVEALATFMLTPAVYRFGTADAYAAELLRFNDADIGAIHKDAIGPDSVRQLLKRARELVTEQADESGKADALSFLTELERKCQSADRMAARRELGSIIVALVNSHHKASTFAGEFSERRAGMLDEIIAVLDEVQNSPAMEETRAPRTPRLPSAAAEVESVTTSTDERLAARCKTLQCIITELLDRYTQHIEWRKRSASDIAGVNNHAVIVSIVNQFSQEQLRRIVNALYADERRDGEYPGQLGRHFGTISRLLAPVIEERVNGATSRPPRHAFSDEALRELLPQLIGARGNVAEQQRAVVSMIQCVTGLVQQLRRRTTPAVHFRHNDDKRAVYVESRSGLNDVVFVVGHFDEPYERCYAMDIGLRLDGQYQVLRQRTGAGDFRSILHWRDTRRGGLHFSDDGDDATVAATPTEGDDTSGLSCLFDEAGDAADPSWLTDASESAQHDGVDAAGDDDRIDEEQRQRDDRDAERVVLGPRAGVWTSLIDVLRGLSARGETLHMQFTDPRYSTSHTVEVKLRLEDGKILTNCAIDGRATQLAHLAEVSHALDETNDGVHFLRLCLDSDILPSTMQRDHRVLEQATWLYRGYLASQMSDDDMRRDPPSPQHMLFISAALRKPGGPFERVTEFFVRRWQQQLKDAPQSLDFVTSAVHHLWVCTEGEVAEVRANVGRIGLTLNPMTVDVASFETKLSEMIDLTQRIAPSYIELELLESLPDANFSKIIALCGESFRVISRATRLMLAAVTARPEAERRGRIVVTEEAAKSIKLTDDYAFVPGYALGTLISGGRAASAAAAASSAHAAAATATATAGAASPPTSDEGAPIRSRVTAATNGETRSAAAMAMMVRMFGRDATREVKASASRAVEWRNARSLRHDEGYRQFTEFVTGAHSPKMRIAIVHSSARDEACLTALREMFSVVAKLDDYHAARERADRGRLSVQLNANALDQLTLLKLLGAIKGDEKWDRSVMIVSETLSAHLFAFANHVPTRVFTTCVAEVMSFGDFYSEFPVAQLCTVADAKLLYWVAIGADALGGPEREGYRVTLHDPASREDEFLLRELSLGHDLDWETLATQWAGAFPFSRDFVTTCLAVCRHPLRLLASLPVPVIEQLSAGKRITQRGESHWFDRVAAAVSDPLVSLRMRRLYADPTRVANFFAAAKWALMVLMPSGSSCGVLEPFDAEDFRAAMSAQITVDPRKMVGEERTVDFIRKLVELDAYHREALPTLSQGAIKQFFVGPPGVHAMTDETVKALLSLEDLKIGSAFVELLLDAQVSDVSCDETNVLMQHAALREIGAISRASAADRRAVTTLSADASRFLSTRLSPAAIACVIEECRSTDAIVEIVRVFRDGDLVAPVVMTLCRVGKENASERRRQRALKAARWALCALETPIALESAEVLQLEQRIIFTDRSADFLFVTGEDGNTDTEAVVTTRFEVLRTGGCELLVRHVIAAIGRMLAEHSGTPPAMLFALRCIKQLGADEHRAILRVARAALSKVDPQDDVPRKLGIAVALVWLCCPTLPFPECIAGAERTETLRALRSLHTAHDQTPWSEFEQAVLTDSSVVPVEAIALCGLQHLLPDAVLEHFKAIFEWDMSLERTEFFITANDVTIVGSGRHQMAPIVITAVPREIPREVRDAMFKRESYEFDDILRPAHICDVVVDVDSGVDRRRVAINLHALRLSLPPKGTVDGLEVSRYWLFCVVVLWFRAAGVVYEELHHLPKNPDVRKQIEDSVAFWKNMSPAPNGAVTWGAVSYPATIVVHVIRNSSTVALFGSERSSRQYTHVAACGIFAHLPAVDGEDLPDAALLDGTQHDKQREYMRMLATVAARRSRAQLQKTAEKPSHVALLAPFVTFLKDLCLMSLLDLAVCGARAFCEALFADAAEAAARDSAAPMRKVSARLVSDLLMCIGFSGNVSKVLVDAVILAVATTPGGCVLDTTLLLIAFLGHDKSLANPPKTKIPVSFPTPKCIASADEDLLSHTCPPDRIVSDDRRLSREASSETRQLSASNIESIELPRPLQVRHSNGAASAGISGRAPRNGLVKATDVLSFFGKRGGAKASAGQSPHNAQTRSSDSVSDAKGSVDYAPVVIDCRDILSAVSCEWYANVVLKPGYNCYLVEHGARTGGSRLLQIRFETSDERLLESFANPRRAWEYCSRLKMGSVLLASGFFLVRTRDSQWVLQFMPALKCVHVGHALALHKLLQLGGAGLDEAVRVGMFLAGLVLLEVDRAYTIDAAKSDLTVVRDLCAAAIDTDEACAKVDLLTELCNSWIDVRRTRVIDAVDALRVAIEKMRADHTNPTWNPLEHCGRFAEYHKVIEYASTLGCTRDINHARSLLTVLSRRGESSLRTDLYALDVVLGVKSSSTVEQLVNSSHQLVRSWLAERNKAARFEALRRACATATLTIEHCDEPVPLPPPHFFASESGDAREGLALLPSGFGFGFVDIRPKTVSYVVNCVNSTQSSPETISEAWRYFQFATIPTPIIDYDSNTPHQLGVLFDASVLHPSVTNDVDGNFTSELRNWWLNVMHAPIDAPCKQWLARGAIAKQMEQPPARGDFAQVVMQCLIDRCPLKELRHHMLCRFRGGDNACDARVQTLDDICMRIDSRFGIHCVESTPSHASLSKVSRSIRFDQTLNARQMYRRIRDEFRATTTHIIVLPPIGGLERAAGENANTRGATAMHDGGYYEVSDTFLKLCCEYTEKRPFRFIVFVKLLTHFNAPENRDRVHNLVRLPHSLAVGRRVRINDSLLPVEMERGDPLEHAPVKHILDKVSSEIKRPQDVLTWVEKLQQVLHRNGSCMLLLESPPGIGKTFEVRRICDSDKDAMTVRIDASDESLSDESFVDVLERLLPFDVRGPSTDTVMFVTLVIDEYHMIESEEKKLRLAQYLAQRASWLKVVFICNRTDSFDKTTVLKEFRLQQSLAYDNAAVSMIYGGLTTRSVRNAFNNDKAVCVPMLERFMNACRLCFGDESVTLRLRTCFQTIALNDGAAAAVSTSSTSVPDATAPASEPASPTARSRQGAGSIKVADDVVSRVRTRMADKLLALGEHGPSMFVDTFFAIEREVAGDPGVSLPPSACREYFRKWVGDGWKAFVGALYLSYFPVAGSDQCPGDLLKSFEAVMQDDVRQYHPWVHLFIYICAVCSNSAVGELDDDMRRRLATSLRYLDMVAKPGFPVMRRGRLKLPCIDTRCDFVTLEGADLSRPTVVLDLMRKGHAVNFAEDVAPVWRVHHVTDAKVIGDMLLFAPRQEAEIIRAVDRQNFINLIRAGGREVLAKATLRSYRGLEGEVEKPDSPWMMVAWQHLVSELLRTRAIRRHGGGGGGGGGSSREELHPQWYDPLGATADGDGALIKQRLSELECTSPLHQTLRNIGMEQLLVLVWGGRNCANELTDDVAASNAALQCYAHAMTAQLLRAHEDKLFDRQMMISLLKLVWRTDLERLLVVDVPGGTMPKHRDVMPLPLNWALELARSNPRSPSHLMQLLCAATSLEGLTDQQASELLEYLQVDTPQQRLKAADIPPEVIGALLDVQPPCVLRSITTDAERRALLLYDGVVDCGLHVPSRCMDGVRKNIDDTVRSLEAEADIAIGGSVGDELRKQFRQSHYSLKQILDVMSGRGEAVSGITKT